MRFNVLWLCDRRFLLESAADKGISVCRSQREVRRPSCLARRKRGLRRASGSQRGLSGSSRAPLRKIQSRDEEQVRPDGVALSVTDHLVNHRHIRLVQTLVLTKPVGA